MRINRHTHLPLPGEPSSTAHITEHSHSIRLLRDMHIPSEQQCFRQNYRYGTWDACEVSHWTRARYVRACKRATGRSRRSARARTNHTDAFGVGWGSVSAGGDNLVQRPLDKHQCRPLPLLPGTGEPRPPVRNQGNKHEARVYCGGGGSVISPGGTTHPRGF